MTDHTGELRIYTTVTCGPCWVMKLWLKRQGIPYTEISIENDAKARRFVRRVADGYLSVPTVALPNGRVLIEPTPAQLQAALAP